MTCDLCAGSGGELLWEDPRCRVVLIEEPGYAGYCRVIWNSHIAEMTDLDDADRQHCLRVVLTVETVLRELLAPHKVNLASLGNFTPHVHWHVIPRFHDDPHFPQPIWGPRQREAPPREAVPVNLRDRIARKLTVRLGG
jgi:diadenosine tetraphosphate (Ap4A) HIT family hydrolase